MTPALPNVFDESVQALLTHVLDLGGTFVFAISGGVTAVRRRMDIFGVLVLAFAAGNAGGITRDLLIGAVPPAAVSNWIYLAISVLAGLIVFYQFPLIDRLNYPVLWFDAIGLAFFAVSGTGKALHYGLNPAMAALLGMLTGIGGGMLRDVLANEIPAVLRSDLYALAALACAASVAAGDVLHLHPLGPATFGVALCLVLRFLAIRKGWRLPRARRMPGAGRKSPHAGDGDDDKEN
ncbi:MAG: trimeric intracellular cation channel family protein [Burkholderiales bacterium]|uniref:Trimeric intracellular cation channel family protein n=2 Tax=Ottowia TaxID=219181 RepID=A0ABV6PV53_9BURK|nr:trimeric intracellular cation channel family protein [Burkholderiales bacterium]MBS0404683.1 trimeric intracellular cation channel family protein [Pseudomonadota bacterium]MBS0413373.1 trimeric intracellular cation channel family protein [Pseudomonadota bacterium]